MPSELLDQRLIFAVAQQPFELDSPSGDKYVFCTLLPLLLDDGERAERDDFPNAGLVWWMVKPAIRPKAQPGRLVKGTIERATEFDKGDVTKSYYQVNRDSVAPVDHHDVIEVVSLPASAVNRPRDLVSVSAPIVLNRPPAGMVFVRWMNDVYGPFTTSVTGSGIEYRVALKPHANDLRVVKLPQAEFARLTSRFVRHIKQAVVSGSEAMRDLASWTLTLDFELLLPDALEQILDSKAERLSLESEVEIVRKVARRLLSRSKRQQLMQAIDELIKSESTALEPMTVAERDLISALRSGLGDEEDAFRQIASGLVASGLLKPQLDQITEDAVLAHIEQNAAQIQGRITQKVAQLEERHALLEEALRNLGDELEQRRRKAQADLQEDLDAKKADVDRNIAQDLEQVKLAKQQVAIQRETVEKTLQGLLDRFESARSETVQEALAVFSIVRELVGFPDTRTAVPGTAQLPVAVADGVEQEMSQPLELPAFVTGPGSHHPPAEEEFWERFKEHAKNSGYTYRDVDLAAFHLSVKSGGLTVLGGPSGVGKSTLPRLYNEALAGERVDERDRMLEVPVSPAWLDTRDVIGYVNTLDRRFQPGECGLFRHLVAAQEEWRAKGDDSGVYIVALDEMNLAHVEHYFASILPIIERSGSERSIKCFDRSAVLASSPFAPYATVAIPATVRFVGTVNFDETTRQLSLRVLDRANLVRLRAGNFSDMLTHGIDDARPPVTGAPVSWRAFRTWTRRGVITDELLTAIDDIRGVLTTAGVALSPRRYQAISAFLASTPPFICTQERALDLQVTQRVLPQIRGWFRADQREALIQLREILEARPQVFEESLAALREIEHNDGALLGVDV